MRRRTVLAVLVVLVGALAVLAAGCGGDEEEAAAPPPAETEVAPAEPTPPAEPPPAEAVTLKIVSDLPLQGSDRPQTAQMNAAIQFYLNQIGYQAGPYTIEFEAFDDSTAAAGKWDEATCASNARTYAEDESIVGVMGTYNSGCAAIIIPILNEAGLAMVSPANTYAGLTHSAPGTEAGEPDKYYPSGSRNYTRVVASDDFQGAVGAKFMKESLGVTKVFILDDKELYGKGVADAFEGFAEEFGLEVVGHEGYDVAASNYKALMTKIKDLGADGIYIGGISTNNGGQLIKDKVEVVGDNQNVKLVVSDGYVLSTLFEEAGIDNLEGAYGTAPTQPPEKLTGAGKEFLDAFLAENPGTVEVYTIYAAAAVQALTDAIARSDGTRADIIAKLFETSVPDGVTGEIGFDENGDPRAKVESIYHATGGAWEWQETVVVE